MHQSGARNSIVVSDSNHHHHQQQQGYVHGDAWSFCEGVRRARRACKMLLSVGTSVGRGGGLLDLSTSTTNLKYQSQAAVVNPRIIALLAVLASAEQALAGDPANLAGHPGNLSSINNPVY